MIDIQEIFDKEMEIYTKINELQDMIHKIDKLSCKDLEYLKNSLRNLGFSLFSLENYLEGFSIEIHYKLK